MLRSELREMLRWVVQEETADHYSDVRLNSYLNVAYQEVENKILALDRYAFVYEDACNVVSAQRLYPKPVNMKQEIELAYSDNPSTTAYTAMKPKPYEKLSAPELARRYETPTEAAVGGFYAHYGRFFYLGWEPSGAITEGLYLKYVPILIMAAETDVPEISTDLHYMIVLQAGLAALNEMPDTVEKLKEQLKEYEIVLKKTYAQSAAHPLELPLDLGLR